MKNKSIIVLFLFLIVAVVSSCSKDEEKNAPCSAAWANELTDEINAFSAAAQTYAGNPTQENCIAYRQAAQAYLDALEPYGDCTLLTGQDRTSWQNALEEAQESVDNMEC